MISHPVFQVPKAAFPQTCHQQSPGVLQGKQCLMAKPSSGALIVRKVTDASLLVQFHSKDTRLRAC